VNLLISTQDFKPGLTIELDGIVYQILTSEHYKPGKGQAVVRTRLRDIKNGSVFSKTFRSGDKVEQAHVSRKTHQYLYNDGEKYYFMDNDTYDQIELEAEQVGELSKWLKESEDVQIVTHDNQLIGIEVANTVVREVIQTDPGLRGDTASGGNKPAVIEGGAVVTVPLYLENGTKIRVDTRTGEYVERA
jgi:elongation factor P